jgi:hypothetical protein
MREFDVKVTSECSKFEIFITFKFYLQQIYNVRVRILLPLMPINCKIVDAQIFLAMICISGLCFLTRLRKVHCA